MLNANMLQAVVRMGRRLAEAGREARAASQSVAGPAADQVTEVIGAAVGEVVRAAVIGAVAAALRGATTATPRTTVAPAYDPWDDEEIPATEGERLNDPLPTAKPAWAKASRAVSSALGVAAGAAAAVPGGKLVAAGLGGLAAVAGLAARAAEPTE